MNPAEAYILKQEAPYKTILLQLQVIIEGIMPKAELKYKWRIPVYYVGKLPICYLNQSKDYVDLVFWHRNKLDKFMDHFVTKDRKIVSSLRYKNSNEINEDVIVYVLKKQLEINISPYQLIRNKKL